ncbi:MAG: hypothetical protein BWY68_00777 [bacterium ADurb.Bin400]|jgi:hypothetical protein|nr:MAG: hypothetical protein BWY68_00777 [bacterium ADurb.Bin400]
MNRIKKTIAKAGMMLLPMTPLVALAQFGEINTFIGRITTFINNTLIPLVFGIALLMFVWGMFKFFIYNTEEEKEKGKDLALYAIVAFVLMVSVWGIVNLIAGGLGFSGEQIQNIPSTPTR